MRCLMLLCLLVSVTVRAQDAFVLAGNAVAQGTLSSFTVAVAGTEIPISVIRGATPGPVLTLTAGIHGDEFPSIFALQQLRNQVDPATLSGTLVLVHLANLQGFHGRRIALNPVDEKNLNRVFPGSAAGTATEQLAYFLTTQVIPQTDYLIDLHSGSSYQTLLPHVYSPVVYDEALDQRTLAFAKATGVGHIVLYDERPRDPANSISYPNTAQTRGKPGLTLEVGHLAQRDEQSIRQVLASCLNAMRHLGMLDEAELSAAAPQLYRKLEEVPSPVTGIFHPASVVGDVVEAGTLLGTVTDYFGTTIAELHAPVRGTLLMLHQTPPIRAGEVPATIAVAE
jgi:uncharacterized protein